jgi:DNA polymerase-3 subunit alpha (Gram-positive type)
MPFIAVPMLGEKSAELLEEKAKEMEFTSVEELKRECNLSQSVVETMREMGCLSGLPEKAQLTLFEVFGM